MAMVDASCVSIGSYNEFIDLNSLIWMLFEFSFEELIWWNLIYNKILFNSIKCSIYLK